MKRSITSQPATITVCNLQEQFIPKVLTLEWPIKQRVLERTMLPCKKIWITDAPAMIFSSVKAGVSFPAHRLLAEWNLVNHKIKTNERSEIVVCGETKGKRVHAWKENAWKQGEWLRPCGKKIEIVQWVGGWVGRGGTVIVSGALVYLATKTGLTQMDRSEWERQITRWIAFLLDCTFKAHGERWMACLSPELTCCTWECVYMFPLWCG